MKLSDIKKGKQKEPLKVLIYGDEGIGKSRFGSQAPNPVFICAEKGVSHLNTSSWEPESLGDVMSAIDTLIVNEHEYKTLVIDSLDWLESMVFKEVCEEHGFKSIGDTGSGKKIGSGYVVALDKWRILISKLEELREKKNMHIVLVAHSQIKSFSNPQGEDYDRHELALTGKTSGLWKQWVKVLLYVENETSVDEAERGSAGFGKKNKGYSTGRRIVHTKKTAAFDAKSHYPMPHSFEFSEGGNSWNEFIEAIKSMQDSDG